MHQNYWARNPLAQLWGRFALSLIENTQQPELYWFLITKGYKTYRFLPVFFSEFYPRFDTSTPPWFIEAMQAFGRLKYPQNFDPRHGIVRTDDNGCRLRPHVAEINDQRLRDPHIEFFARCNPGHVRGDELCCLAPLTRENFTPAANRVIGTPAAICSVS